MGGDSLLRTRCLGSLRNAPLGGGSVDDDDEGWSHYGRINEVGSHYDATRFKHVLHMNTFNSAINQPFYIYFSTLQQQFITTEQPHFGQFDIPIIYVPSVPLSYKMKADIRLVNYLHLIHSRYHNVKFGI